MILLIFAPYLSGCDNKPIVVSIPEIKVQKEESEYRDRYVIYNDSKSSSTTAIILDKETGRSWRYFRNTDKDGNTTDEGWTSLMYDVLGSKGVTPDIALENSKNAAANK